MIRLIAAFKRHPDLTREQFLDHWRTTHAEIIKTTSAPKYVRYYHQYPVVASGVGEPEPPYDGITIEAFDSIEAYEAHQQEPDFAQQMDDIQQFLDVGSIQAVLVDDPNIVIDGPMP